MPVAAVPAPIGGRSEAQNREAVDAVIGDIITALTKFPVVTEGKDKGQEETITVTGKDYREASEKMTALFVEKLWGDGFPLIPPTKDAVEKMLKGTSHSPDEVLGVLEQRKGIATVKNVAINAVMAGCKPEYLPSVLAAVKAVTDPTYNLYGVNATTSPAIPVIVINGPIRNELGIHCQQGSWGPGHPANATIGRAFNLVMTTVGGRLESSMSSVADPGRYSWCFGEWEEELPAKWIPMHVEKGYKPEESTATVMCVHWRTPIHGFFAPTNDQDAVNHVAHTIREEMPHGYGEAMLSLLPEIAEQLSRTAPTKLEFKKLMMEMSQVPWKEMKERQQAKIGDFPPKGYPTPGEEDTYSPILLKPEDLNIVVTGGAGRHSYLLYPWIRTHTITSSIDYWK